MSHFNSTRLFQMLSPLLASTDDDSIHALKFRNVALNEMIVSAGSAGNLNHFIIAPHVGSFHGSNFSSNKISSSSAHSFMAEMVSTRLSRAVGGNFRIFLR